jgi:hypothetical protein
MATRLGAAHCSSRVSSMMTTRSVFATSASSALVSVVLPVGAAAGDEDVGAGGDARRSASACAADMIRAAT